MLDVGRDVVGVGRDDVDVWRDDVQREENIRQESRSFSELQAQSNGIQNDVQSLSERLDIFTAENEWHHGDYHNIRDDVNTLEEMALNTNADVEEIITL